MTRTAAPLVVVGDALLDIDTYGEATRLCPDAPVPVFDAIDDRPRAGGAALAATLAARGDRPVVLLAPLCDSDAAQLRGLLDPRVELLALPTDGRLAVKRRLRAGGQTLLRVDHGSPGAQIEQVPVAARDAIGDAAAVLVADYGGATTTSPAIRELLGRFAARGSLTWDPHPRGAVPVSSAGLVTPNAREAAEFAPAITGDDAHAIRRRAEFLRGHWGVRSVAVTVGAQGAVLATGAGAVSAFPAPAVSAADSCGAGDCFAAAAARTLADGGLASDAVAAAVTEAAAFVAAGGASALSGPHQPAPPVRTAPARAGRPGIRVATGGCFDLLHAGHIATLEAARALGDSLTVCVNSDASVRRLKGSARPLQPVADRVRVLAALRCVDEVIVFEQDTPAQLLRTLRPDIWVKGGDYDGHRLPEAAVLAEWDGEVVTVPYVSGRSTTGLISQART